LGGVAPLAPFEPAPAVIVTRVKTTFFALVIATAMPGDVRSVSQLSLASLRARATRHRWSPSA
jgi:hypothetical protein